MSDTLIQFGHSFQKKIIVLLLFNRRFLQTISDIILSEYFDSDADKWLVRSIKKYYEKYKVEPTLEALKIQIDDISSEILKKLVVDNLKEAFQHREATDLEFVEEKVFDGSMLFFFAEQTVIPAVQMYIVATFGIDAFDRYYAAFPDAAAAFTDGVAAAREQLWLQALEKTFGASSLDAVEDSAIVYIEKHEDELFQRLEKYLSE